MNTKWSYEKTIGVFLKSKKTSRTDAFCLTSIPIIKYFVLEHFTNQSLALEDLPQYETIKFSPISKNLRSKSLVQLSILTLLFIAGAGFYFYKEGFEEVSWLIMGLIILFLIIRFIDVILKQSRYGYAIREMDILFKSGYISSKIIIIPFNRIQHSAINRSFFDKIFGISSLKIYTAGGSGSDMSIPGLLPEEAIQLNQLISFKISENA